MTATYSVDYSAFAPSVPIPVTRIGLSSCSYSLQPLQKHPTRRSFHARRPFRSPPTSPRRLPPNARISHGLPAYRAALLTRRDAPPATANRASTLTDTTALPTVEPKRTGKRPDTDPRYTVRMAGEGELYTVADIRCEAFYGYPKDPYYYPVRRREIYMAMRDRIDSGNKCLVVVDTQPPEDWRSFASEGGLVVGSLDVSLHKAASGRRCQFGKTTVAWEKEQGKRIYISSMAVREEWQGRGLAQRLLAHVDVTACAHGIKEIFLHVEWENAPAVHVYRKCGFLCVEEDDRVPRWLHFLAKPEHTLMQKSLE